MLRACLRKLQSLWSESEFAQNVVVLASGTGAAQLVGLASAPILTRLYPAADFGLFAVFASALSILTVAATLRYKLAIPLPESESTSANVLALGVLVSLGVAAAVALGIAAVGGRAARLANVAEIAPFLWLLPIAVAGVGIYEAFNYWAVRRSGFKSIARTKLTKSLVKASTQLGLGVAGSGPFGLAFGRVAGEVAGTGTLVRWAWKDGKEHLADLSWSDIRKVAVRYRRFPLYSSGASVFNRCGLELPALLLASLYGADVAGWYALSRRAVAAPMNMLGNAVSEVYIGEAPRLAREDPTELRRLFRETTLRLALIGLVPVAVVVLGGPALFEFVFGEGWANVGLYVRLLGLMFLAKFVVAPVSQTLNILERQDLQFYWDASRLVLAAVALTVPDLMGLDDRWAIGSFGAVMFATYVVLYLLSRSVLPEAGAGSPHGRDGTGGGTVAPTDPRGDEDD